MAKIDVKKYSEIDLYKLIGVEITATDVEIRKAYRKKALQCHPDKNPDNPKANELFNELSVALEILTNEVARVAYNKIINAKKAAELRNQQLDSRRKKIKSDLEERERNAEAKSRQKYTRFENKTFEQTLEEEIQRLREEGSRLLEEEHKLMQKIIAEENLKKKELDLSKQRIKIKWKSAKDDPTNGGYTKEILDGFLKKYGEIVALVVSSKKGSALVEFKTQEASEMAVLYEKGNLSNPLTLEWLEKGNSTKDKTNNPPSGSFLPFESLVLRQMRQAEERRKLIEQMEREDLEN